MIEGQWFLNNNNTGAANALLALSAETEELTGSPHYSYGPSEKVLVQRQIDKRGLRVLLVGVKWINGRHPNNDIVSVEVYPPLENDDRNNEILEQARQVMDANNVPDFQPTTI